MRTMRADPAVRDSDWQALVELGRLWTRPVGRGIPAYVPLGSRLTGLSYQLDGKAEQAVCRHVFSCPSTEVGGLLAGSVHEESGSYFVSVSGALPADHTEAGATHLTFTGDTWLGLIHGRRAMAGPVIVGWYHSHPGAGVFLSPFDSFVHRSFFGDTPWYLALVVDSVSGDRAAFDRCGAEIPLIKKPSSLSDRHKQGGQYQ